MKSITLTSTKTARYTFGIIGLLVMLSMMFGGCASTKYVDQKIAEERQARVQSVRVSSETTATGLKVLAATVEDLQKKHAEVPGQIAQAVGPLSGAIGAHTRDIAELKNDTANLRVSAARHDRWLTKTEGEVAKVKATANTAVAKTTALTKRIGTMETTEYDHNGRPYPQLIKFPTAELMDRDAKEPVFKACSELLPGSKKYLDEKVVALVKDGKVARQISGFADSRPFVDSRGKPREDSDKLNAACADDRARAVYQYLVEVLDPGQHALIENAVVKGMGKTTRFGRHDADRSVVVELAALL